MLFALKSLTQKNEKSEDTMFGKKNIDLNLRAEPDFWARSIKKFACVSWYLAGIVLLIAVFALPPVRFFINTSFDLNLKTKWSQSLLQIDFYLLLTIFIVSSVGLYINSIRHRRRNDQYNASLIYFTLLSALSIIGYIIFLKLLK